ncbi:MAG: hypothetical protein WC480_05035 [Patescibacteria group bacterium]
MIPNIKKISLILVLLSSFIIVVSGVSAMQSTHFQIGWDAFSVGGSESGSSTHYQLHDTSGEVGPGGSTSTNYDLLTGYRAGEGDIIRECNDGADNDGDGYTDFPADSDCDSSMDDSESGGGPHYPACSDGLDNDSDGKIDYPADPGCYGADDEDESDPFIVVPLQCNDGLDNDGDGRIDYPADPGCASAGDNDENDSSATYQCNDGVDNDSDGRIDYPADPGCSSSTDDIELSQCADGLDNDADGWIDYPADSGCDGLWDDNESIIPQCSDGIDNDGDSLTDYPADPGCASASDDSETNLIIVNPPVVSNFSITSIVSVEPGYYEQSEPAPGADEYYLVQMSANSQDNSADFKEVNFSVNGTKDSGSHQMYITINSTPVTFNFGPVVGPNWSFGGSLILAVDSHTIMAVAQESVSGTFSNVSNTLDFTVVGAYQCNDGLDNDGDGNYDYGIGSLSDPDCSAWNDNSEGGTTASACSDGLDNDGDSKIDYPADPGCSSVSDNDEADPAGPTYQCSDGLDNDGDSKIDYPADPGCGSVSDNDEADLASVYQCNDGLDNDGDSKIDYPADPGCSSASDNDEIDSVGPSYQCNDSLDNDGDGFIDYPADPGCDSAVDDSEADSAPSYQCSDGIDNDGDGLIDLSDPGCSSISDDDETNPASIRQCSDGLDNDGDSLIDYPADPGCDSVADDDEADSSPSYQCSDGLDNDSDGLIDLSDPGCADSNDNDEYNVYLPKDVYQCSDGLDNDGDSLIDYPADPGCVNTNDNDEYDAPLPKTTYQCSDGLDNDGDGFIDYPADPGCADSNDNDEYNLLEKKVVDEVINYLTGDLAVVSRVTEAFKEIPVVKRVLESRAVRLANEAVFDNFQVEKTNRNIAVPLIVTISVANVATAASAIGFLPYLPYLFTEPLLFFFRKRRKTWGVVYNSLSKQPVDLAIVRLYKRDMAHPEFTGQLMGTKVTDRLGRYYFVTEPGADYYLTVTKPNFVYPSVITQGRTEDDKYTNVYHAESITITKDNNIINFNIPIDPDLPVESDAAILRRHALKRAQRFLAYLGPILAVFSLIVSPTRLILIILIIHLILFTIFRRLMIKPVVVSNPGKVNDKSDQKPVKHTIIRVFDTQYNKLLGTEITNSLGQYCFLVSPGEYYLTASKAGYQKYQSTPLNLQNQTEPVIREIIHLNPAESNQGPLITKPPLDNQPPVIPPAQPPVSPDQPSSPTA